MNKAERKVIELLLDVANKAFFAMDDTCEDDNGLHWDAQSFNELSEAMDKLDDLPDDKPDVTMGPATKAEWALRGCFPELRNQSDADRIADLERQLADARAEIEAAYREGFFARETYNDMQLNDVDEEFKKSDASKAIAALQAGKEKEHGN